MNVAAKYIFRPSPSFSASRMPGMRKNRYDQIRTKSVRAKTTLFASALLLIAVSNGCGALLLVGGAGTSAIAFATGELHTTEEASLAQLDAACESAAERLGYESIEIERLADRLRLSAMTASGEPVSIRLASQEPGKTDLRIRIGTFGDEAASRLVLEEIHQSL